MTLRKFGLVVSLLFVFAFVFSVIVTTYETAQANPNEDCAYLPYRPGCCIYSIVCPPYGEVHCGYGVFDKGKCVLSSSMDCPSPAGCSGG